MGHIIVYGRYFKIIDWRSTANPSSSTYNMLLCIQVKSGMEGASNKIPDIINILMTRCISSYFAKYGVRCSEFKNIAEYNNLIVCSFLKIFEIRWSEFTHQLV